MKSFLLLLVILDVVNAQAVQGILGSAVSLTAQSTTTINYGPLGTAPTLVIQVNASTNLTVNIFVLTNLNAMGNLPTGYSALTVATAVGFTVTLSNSAAIVSANLTTPAIDANTAQTINTTGRVGCLEFTASSHSYQDIAVNSFSAANGISIPIPEAGTYVLAAVNLNAATPNFYSRIKKLVANVKSTVAYASNFTTNFVVSVTADANADLNVTFYSSNPAPQGPPATLTPLGVYWQIDATAGANVNAQLNYTYTAQQLTAAGIATANTLKFAFYNTTSGAWQALSGANVDVNAQVVSQTTTHFSTWGVYSDNSGATSAGQGSATMATTHASAQGLFVSAFLLFALLAMFL